MTDYKRLTSHDFVETITANDAYNTTLIEYALRLWQLENQIENGTLIGLPCVRKINSGLGKYEAVYFKEHFATIAECVVNSIEQGWEIIAYYGNAHCKAEAEATLAKLQGGDQ